MQDKVFPAPPCTAAWAQVSIHLQNKDKKGFKSKSWSTMYLLLPGHKFNSNPFQNKSNRSVHCMRTRIAWQQEVSNENTDLSAYRQKLNGHGTFSLTQPSHEDPGTLEKVPAHSIRTITRRNPSLSSIQVFLTCGTLPPFFPAAQG